MWKSSTFGSGGCLSQVPGSIVVIADRREERQWNGRNSDGVPAFGPGDLHQKGTKPGGVRKNRGIFVGFTLWGCRVYS